MNSTINESDPIYLDDQEIGQAWQTFGEHVEPLDMPKTVTIGSTVFKRQQWVVVSYLVSTGGSGLSPRMRLEALPEWIKSPPPHGEGNILIHSIREVA